MKFLNSQTIAEHSSSLTLKESLAFLFQSSAVYEIRSYNNVVYDWCFNSVERVLWGAGKDKRRKEKYKNMDDITNKRYEKSGFLKGLSKYIIAQLSRKKANEIKAEYTKVWLCILELQCVWQWFFCCLWISS